MHSPSREAYLAKITSWARERNAVGPGSWSSYNRDFLQKLQQAGDPFITGIALGADLFNTPEWELTMDDMELSAQKLHANMAYDDPFADLMALSAQSSFIPAPLNLGANPLRGPAFGGGLNSGLQTVSKAAPMVGAPAPVSSNIVGAQNAPEFMNPDPRLEPGQPIPVPGSMVDVNPSTPETIPSIVPPPPGGPIPQPLPLPGSTQQAAERKAARDVTSLIRKLMEKKGKTEKPPQPSTSRTGFPDVPGLAAIYQVLALRIREYSRAERPGQFTMFQRSMSNLRVVYEDQQHSFLDHLRTLKFRIENLFKDTDIERFTKVFHLPFKGNASLLYPWLASELIDTVNGIREGLAEAEVLAVSWSAPVSEQNFLDFALNFGDRLTQSGQTLIRLYACVEQLSDSITAPSAFPLPRINTLEDALAVFSPRAESMPREIKLWQAILDTSVRTPGVDYRSGLDHPILREWIQYEPLTSKFSSLAEALVVAFTQTAPEAAAVRAFVADLANQATLLQNDILNSIIVRFSSINEVVQALFSKAVNNAVNAERSVVGFCIEAIEQQSRLFTRLSSGAEIFSGAESSAQKTLTTAFRALWKSYSNQRDNPNSMLRLLELLKHPDLLDLLPTDFGVKKQAIRVRSELLGDKFQSAMFWHNTCEDCGLAVAEFCSLCVIPLCDGCFNCHVCPNEPNHLNWSRAALSTMCKVTAPPHVAQLVLHDQDVYVGAKKGQLLGYEYSCLQATQIPSNANLFHLLSIKCNSAPLSIRYLRVTVHSVLPIGKDDPIHILINGGKVKSQISYGKVNGRAPLLRSRSLVIPEGAQVSWLRESDEVWLHGQVADIQLPEGAEINIRLQLPIQLQPIQVFTKNVTASLEIVLTSQ